MFIMRSIIVVAHISLDGVIQAPGGAQEDTSNDFPYGGWIAHHSDEILGKAIRSHMNLPFDLLIGRKTYDIWAPYWPQHGDIWKGVNAATKYIASNTMTVAEWQPAVILSGDIIEKIIQIKQQPGPDLHVYGSGHLLQTLLKHDLVDELWLKIYPLALGKGKRLFGDGTVFSFFKVTESMVSPEGVIIINYVRDRSDTQRD